MAGGQFLIGDPGNNRIAMVDATAGNTATITTWATCPGCTGLFISGTSAYATSTSGQIYYISAQGATAVSLGFSLGTAVDGPLGQIASFTPTATPTLTPVNYLLQFQAKSFFDTANNTSGIATPYTLAPFNGTKVFSAPPAAGVGSRRYQRRWNNRRGRHQSDRRHHRGAEHCSGKRRRDAG